MNWDREAIIQKNKLALRRLVSRAGSVPSLEALTGIHQATIWRILKSGRMRFDISCILNEHLGKTEFRATHGSRGLTIQVAIDFNDAEAIRKWNAEHPVTEEFLFDLAVLLGDRK